MNLLFSINMNLNGIFGCIRPVVTKANFSNEVFVMNSKENIWILYVTGRITKFRETKICLANAIFVYNLQTEIRFEGPFIVCKLYHCLLLNLLTHEHFNNFGCILREGTCYSPPKVDIFMWFYFFLTIFTVYKWNCSMPYVKVMYTDKIFWQCSLFRFL